MDPYCVNRSKALKLEDDMVTTRSSPGGRVEDRDGGERFSAVLGPDDGRGTVVDGLESHAAVEVHALRVRR